MKEFRILLASLLLCAMTGEVWAQTASINDILWKEEFKGGTGTTTFSTTSSWNDYINPTTLVDADKSHLIYVSKNAMISNGNGANMSGSHVWINKKTTGFITINGIKLYNASKVRASWNQGGASQLTVAYAFDDETTYTDFGSTSVAGANIISDEIDVTGHETISLKFYRTSTNTNIRIDNLTLTATEVSDSKEDIVTVSSISPTTLSADTDGNFVAVYTKADELLEEGHDFDITWQSSNNSVIEITNTTTGAFHAKGRGTTTIILTFTPNDTEKYRSVTKEITVNVTSPVEVHADNIIMTYGDATRNIDAKTSTDYKGILTYICKNTDIAVVDALGNVTALAVGNTTITISTSADIENLYTSGDDIVINVNVNEAEASEIDDQIIAEEHFTEMKSTNGSEITIENCDYKGWENINKVFGTTGFIWIASGGYDGSMSTGTLKDLRKDATISLKASGNSAGDELTITPTGCTLDQTSIITTSSWEDYTIKVTAVTGSPSIKFSAKQKKQINLDDIIISQPQSDIPVTIAANKEWVTYCSPYVLDFTDDVEDLQGAYYVNGHDDKATTLTVTKIAGKVPAKTGMLLHVTPSAETQTIKLPIGDTGTPLSGNKLVGVLSPTYIEPTSGVNTNLGLAGGEFVGFNNAGIIGANKAYLQIPTSEMPTEDNGDAKLTIIIDDSDTAAIKAIENEQYPTTISMYNIAGQRVNGSYKGIVIHNGKKSVVK